MSKPIVPNPESPVKPPPVADPCALLLAAEAHRLEPDEFRVYVALVLRAGPEGVAIRVRELCEIVLLGERRVRYVLKLLEAAGFIKRIGWTRNRRYLVNPVSDWVPAEQLPALRERIYTNRRHKPSDKPETAGAKAKKPARPKAPSSRKPKPPASGEHRVAASQPVEPLREYLPLTRAVLEAIRSPDGGVSETRRALVLALAKRGRWDSFHRLLRRRARDSAAWTAWLEGLAQNYAEKGEPYLEALLKALDRLEARPDVREPFAWLPKVALNIYEGREPHRFRRPLFEPDPDFRGVISNDMPLDRDGSPLVDSGSQTAVYHPPEAPQPDPNLPAVVYYPPEAPPPDPNPKAILLDADADRDRRPRRPSPWDEVEA